LLLALVILSKAELTERAILHYAAVLKEGEIGNKLGGGMVDD
jgi:hypothetical protein